MCHLRASSSFGFAPSSSLPSSKRRLHLRNAREAKSVRKPIPKPEEGASNDGASEVLLSKTSFSRRVRRCKAARAHKDHSGAAQQRRDPDVKGMLDGADEEEEKEEDDRRIYITRTFARRPTRKYAPKLFSLPRQNPEVFRYLITKRASSKYARQAREHLTKRSLKCCRLWRHDPLSRELVRARPRPNV